MLDEIHFEVTGEHLFEMYMDNTASHDSA